MQGNSGQRQTKGGETNEKNGQAIVMRWKDDGLEVLEGVQGENG